MSQSKERTERRLKLAEAKRAQCFMRMQSVHDIIPKISSDVKSYAQFVAQARMVDQWRSEFMELMDEINLLNMELDPEYAVNYKAMNAFEDIFCIVKCQLSKIDAPAPKTSTSVRDSTHTCREESIKIPRIDLPTFDGDIQNFPFFYETFKRVIHENNTLTDSERVHYLFSHLTGKAKSVCSGVIPAAENYNTVWEALIAKYDDKRALATSYLNKLFSMKPVNGPSACNLEKVIDSFAATISAIKQLKLDNLSEFIFIHLGLKLLDSDTAKSFEMSIRNSTQMPSYDEFIRFVREQVKILYRTSQQAPSKAEGGSTNNTGNARGPLPRTPQAYVSTQAQQENAHPCAMCNSTEHSQLYNCNAFIKLTPNERYNFIKEIHACSNCLNTQHTASKCVSKKTCRKCKGKHHSTLHFDSKPVMTRNVPTVSATSTYNQLKSASNEATDANTTSSITDKGASVCTLSASVRAKSHSTEILATAKVLASGRNGKDKILRCLLDPGSQKHYVTSKCCKNLGLTVNNSPLTSVKGIGGATQPVRGYVTMTFRSRYDTKREYTIDALVLDEITSLLPTCPVDQSSFDLFDNVELADDTWAIPGEIDLLVGVKLFAEMLRSGKIVNKPGFPDALETALGYIVLGDAPAMTAPSSAVGYFSSVDVGNLMQRFWEIEDLSDGIVQSAEEKQAEEIFKNTVNRLENGRYEVALPFKSEPSNLGDSYKTAERRYYTLERKFRIQPKLKPLYDEVIREHIDKNYLSEVQNDQSDKAYYIPHHAIVREDRTTTKVRVVLDASAKTTSGLSLNDILHAGPSLQADLFCILLNLRLFAVAITSDVRQMYLCIDVRKEDRPFQRILYRFSPEETLKVFQYNRVAFGLRSSPFLALRTVKQLVADEGSKFPLAEDIASRDIYMDDVATSVIDEAQAVQATNELLKLFIAGGFQLAKWSSNSTAVLKEIPEELRLSQSVTFDDDTTLKILGLRWYPGEDVFKFQVTPDDRPCTKRNILSSVARLFDVLGLVAPVIVFAKLLIKELWLLKIDWDEVPPDHVVRLWQQFQSELPLLSNISFPRHIGVIESCSLTIVGFADASEKAYGGMVYAYVTFPDNDCGHTFMICAKSKVAPVKVVSLARLELCAALLMSQLIKRVVDTYSTRYPIKSVIAFCDSTVALCWIHSSPHRWQTFVANRVVKIQDNLSSDHFHHVKGSENPSDCLSRGLTPAQLVSHPLWLSGPPWMKRPIAEWPIKPFIPDEVNVPEEKTMSLVTADNSNDSIIYELSKRFSSWNKYVRTVAYILKFINRLPRGPINADDMIKAELEIIRAIQNVYFSQYVSNITSSKGLTRAFAKLKPFIDNGIIRVGGRISNANEDYDYKHPMLLPRRDHIVNLLVDHYHRRHLHTGPETLISILRHRYWIIAARCIIRHRIHLCNYCFRVKPKVTHPIMADLPSYRVNPETKAFIHTGCDYAGPFHCTPIRRRGSRSQKVYLCLFTCLTTRAIHLELATDLSTATFMNAFKRFLARRGPIYYIYSDNGTNFVGANTYLQELHNFLANEYRDVWEHKLAKEHITWKFIPPSAPHFGGCWESEVKNVKTHLFRSIGKQILSFEEMTTVLAEIEALLNCRPLTVHRSDPSEPSVLTPAHFLNNAPLNYLPASSVKESTVDHLLQRYQLLDRLIQSFWKRWRGEYLHALQTRQKWNTPSEPIKEGMVVVILQDNVMPLNWPLGIITKLITGKDGIARVALVKTKSGVFKRPIVKLCPLPSQ